MAALEAQRALLGDAVTELALEPLRQRLARIDHAPQLRRAQVTVLFADIVGSTALARQLDAEDVVSIFGGFLQRAADCVRARGGRVLKFTGDGLKAAFGTTGAHEDDAEQAVQAGLDILAVGRLEAEQLRSRLGLEGLGLRVGVHTGEVAFGAGIEAEDTLTGDAVNVAARMEQSAPPGGLRISADTWALVRGRFLADPQTPLQLKGLDKPLHTWLVFAPVAAGIGGAERGIEGLHVPMVGRAGELARLRQAIVDSAAGLQAVTLVGDAGLGKSRLLREALSGRDPGGSLLQARAQPRDHLQPWGLLRQLVTGFCRIADSDSADMARDKLLAGLLPAFAADAELQARLIGQLIGLDFADAPGLRGLDARARRDRALDALLAWLDGLACQRPGTVIMIEDLHAADDASLDALTHLMKRGSSLPLALLMNARPELLERRPGWGESCIALAPLAASDSDALVTALLPGLRPLPPALSALLTGRAEGNPYYLEELVRRLLDDGVIDHGGAQWQFDIARLDPLRLPTTLVGLLQVRLDALRAPERAGAQSASIVGHVFWDAALAQIDPAAPGAISALRQHGWVRPHEPSAFDGSAEHQFDHHLLHQVTYGTVLKDERRRGHAAVARWLAERTEGRGPEFLAITGEHAERAGEHALAVDCYERAAAEARERYANTLAVHCLQRAVKLMATEESPRRLQALEGLRDLADLLGNRELQAQALDEARAVLARHNDPYALASVTFARALLADRLGQADVALVLATQALVLAEAAGNDDAAALAHGELCWLHGQRGDREAARRHLAAGQVHAQRVRDSKPIRELQLLMMAAVVAIREDRAAEAGPLLQEVLQRSEARRDLRLSLSATVLLCEQMRALGEWAQAVAGAERGLALARQLGDSMREAGLLLELAYSAVVAGDADRALATVASALPIAHGVGAVQCEGYLRFVGGQAHALQGDFRAARQAYLLAQAVHAQNEPGGEHAAAMAAMVARQDLALGDRAAARAGAIEASAALEGGAPAGVVEFAWDGRWACVEIFAALGEPQAAALLGPLQDDVRRVSLARAGRLERAHELQQRIPIFRTILAAPGPITPPPATS